jgi:hypothetical protein
MNMKSARVRLLLLFVAILALGYFSYTRRYQIAAKLWHWRHGNTVTLGKYKIPVPEGWLINSAPAGLTAFILVNTAPARYRDRKFHAPAVINFASFQPIGTSRLDSWLTDERQRLEREGVKAVTERTLHLADETVVCIGGNELREMIKGAGVDTDVISLHCKSDGGLDVLFVGDPTDVDFYTLLAQVAKYH